MPCNTLSLKGVKGMGKKKINKIGKEILDIIIAYRREMNLEVPEMIDITGDTGKKAQSKTNTKQLSYNLLKEGKSIQEIAAERGMAVSTIEGHLAHFVGTGEIGIEQFIPLSKVSVIQEYLQNKKPETLTNAKNELGDEFSYSDIRFVMKHLEYLNSNPE